MCKCGRSPVGPKWLIHFTDAETLACLSVDPLRKDQEPSRDDAAFLVGPRWHANARGGLRGDETGVQARGATEPCIQTLASVHEAWRF
jgi:hypothetical protein